MKITGDINLTGQGYQYSLDYGVVEKGSDGNRTLKVEVDEDIEVLNVKTSCGNCTKAFLDKVDEYNYILNIHYKTTIVGTINKKVFLFPKYRGERGVDQKTTISITGEVTK